MKQIIIIGFLIFSTFQIFGQKKGIVYYGSPSSEEMKQVLVYYGHQSGYHQVKFKNEIQKNSESNYTVSIGESVYFDLLNSSLVHQTILETKDTLSTKISIKNQEWDIKKDTILVLGHKCILAQRVNQHGIISAWFTTDIPVSFGPSKAYGLPGLILKYEVPRWGIRVAKKIIEDEIFDFRFKPYLCPDLTEDDYMKEILKKQNGFLGTILSMMSSSISNTDYEE